MPLPDPGCSNTSEASPAIRITITIIITVAVLPIAARLHPVDVLLDMPLLRITFEFSFLIEAY